MDKDVLRNPPKKVQTIKEVELLKNVSLVHLKIDPPYSILLLLLFCFVNVCIVRPFPRSIQNQREVDKIGGASKYVSSGKARVVVAADAGALKLASPHHTNDGREPWRPVRRIGAATGGQLQGSDCVRLKIAQFPVRQIASEDEFLAVCGQNDRQRFQKIILLYYSQASYVVVGVRLRRIHFLCIPPRAKGKEGKNPLWAVRAPGRTGIKYFSQVFNEWSRFFFLEVCIKITSESLEQRTNRQDIERMYTPTRSADANCRRHHIGLGCSDERLTFYPYSAIDRHATCNTQTKKFETIVASFHRIAPGKVVPFERRAGRSPRRSTRGAKSKPAPTRYVIELPNVSRADCAAAAPPPLASNGKHSAADSRALIAEQRHGAPKTKDSR
ncbi:hypothetical protein EVAR_75665_1 [Eumeta japonica]|uniref:Uncharacterized protein n=1 Tax=Eumeta variegata TaxID=151549 RepID=A0A4C1U032_EUMVA|nr:hypothetical protein EVAR_75665_1 [Eumeta japonica]